jgi:hypothetical protein
MPHRIVAACVALACLAVPASAAADASPTCVSSSPFNAVVTDPALDGYSDAADLTVMRMQISEQCTLTVDTTIGWTLHSEQVLMYFDSDGDAATGDPAMGGADRMVILINKDGRSSHVAVWDASAHAFGPYTAISAAWFSAANFFSWTLPFSTLGFVPGVTAHVRVLAPGYGVTDWMPGTDQPPFAFPVNFATPAPPAAPQPEPAAPALLARARVTGTARVGKRLTCAGGTWSGQPALSYVWRRDGRTIKHQTKSAYTVRKSDRGTRLSCAVTAANAGGTKTVTTNSIRIK